MKIRKDIARYNAALNKKSAEQTIRHWALNPFTGEMFGCSHGNSLKRRVKQASRYYVRDIPNRWLFAHGTREQVEAKFQSKLERYHG